MKRKGFLAARTMVLSRSRDETSAHCSFDEAIGIQNKHLKLNKVLAVLKG